MMNTVRRRVFVFIILFCVNTATTLTTTAGTKITDQTTTESHITDQTTENGGDETTEIIVTTTAAGSCSGMYTDTNVNGACDKTYLYTSGNCCLSQDWIIGLSAGLGGFVILCLVIALIVACCQLSASKKAARLHEQNLLPPTNAYENFESPIIPATIKTTDAAKTPSVKDNVSCNSITDAQRKSEIATFKSPEPGETSASTPNKVDGDKPPAASASVDYDGGYENYFSQQPTDKPPLADPILRPKEDLNKLARETTAHPVDYRSDYRDPGRKQYPDDYYSREKDLQRESRNNYYDDPYSRNIDPYPSRDRYESRDSSPDARDPEPDYKSDQDQPRRKPTRDMSLREQTKPFNYLNATSRDHVGKGMDYAENKDMYAADKGRAGYTNPGYVKNEPADSDFKDFTPSLGHIDTKAEYKINRPTIDPNPSAGYDPYTRSTSRQSDRKY